MTSRFQMALRNRAYTGAAFLACWIWAGHSEGAAPLPQGAVAPRINTGLVLTVDPYAGVDWSLDRQAKANFHTHTTNSDGKIQPSLVIDMYKAAGYDVLAISDHEQCTWPWSAYGRNPEGIGLVAVAGNELSRQHHTLSLFSEYAPTNSYSLNEALAGVGATNGLAVMCHPAKHWPELYPQSLQTPLAAPLKEATRGDFTIETWFRTRKTGRSILMGNFSAANPGALNLELHTANMIRIFLWSSAAGNPVTDLRGSAGALGIDTRNGQWHHLAATRAGDVLSLYLNGTLAARTNGVTSSFDLRGSLFYLGRDTRMDGLHLDGDLDAPRLWSRGLASNEVFLLAQGYSPGTESGIARAGIVFEYGFETSNGVPTLANAAATGPVDDTGGHASGPFHALPGTYGGGIYTTNVPPLLAGRGGSQRALQFSPVHVHPNAVAFYLDLYTRYPHLFGIDVANATSVLALDRELWDLLLAQMMPQRPIWGMGVDDLHFGTGDFQVGWDVLLVPQLDESAVRQSLQNGTYYFSTIAGGKGIVQPDPAQTPRIDAIAHDSATGKITIWASVAGLPLPESAYAWISGGQTVRTGSTLHYRQTAGIGTFVRAEILGPGGRTFTNPFGFSRRLTVTGLIASNKVYDGTPAAVVGGTPDLAGVVPPDEVTLEGIPTFSFAAPDAGTDIPIAAAGYTLGGADAGKYVLAQPALAASILKADQTIDFPAISDQVVGGTLELVAMASSGLAVSFELARGSGTVDPARHALTFTGAGEMCIVASQAGNQNWNPATRAVEFTVAPGSDTVAKAAAAVTLLDLRQPYANAARPVTATTFPAGLALDITYNGGAAAPTNVGIYAVTVQVNEAHYQGTAIATLAVTEAIASLAASGRAAAVTFGPVAAEETYELLYRPSLTNGTWTSVTTLVAGSGGPAAVLTHAAATNACGYYRIKGVAGPSVQMWGYTRLDKPGNSKLNVVGIPFLSSNQTLNSLMDPLQFSGHHNNAGRADQLMMWNPAATAYVSLALYDLRAFGQQFADQTGWKAVSGFGPAAPYTNPVLPAGSAVWIRGSTTNDGQVTIAGEVVRAGAITNNLVRGLQLVANPFSETVGLGDLALHIYATGHYNNAGLADQVMLWDAGSQAYINLALYDLRAFGQQNASKTGWKLVGGFGPKAPYVSPLLPPGRGFWFCAVNHAFQWVEENKHLDALE